MNDIHPSVEWLCMMLDRANVTFDKCYCCKWQGLSEDVKDGQCPRCGSYDMDDIDGHQGEDE